uniref:(northern house mosquito) hypothetical protein n=1 Tax=Culex pipiens TaxID=7175 RepID=A0A8D8FV52_CULPI
MERGCRRVRGRNAHFRPAHVWQRDRGVESGRGTVPGTGVPLRQQVLQEPGVYRGNGFGGPVRHDAESGQFDEVAVGDEKIRQKSQLAAGLLRRRGSLPAVGTEGLHLRSPSPGRSLGVRRQTAPDGHAGPAGSARRSGSKLFQLLQKHRKLVRPAALR